jgi:hypothetical protein
MFPEARKGGGGSTKRRRWEAIRKSELLVGGVYAGEDDQSRDHSLKYER